MLPLFLGSKDESSLWAVVTTTFAVLAVARAALPPEWLAFAGWLRAKMFARLNPYSTYSFQEFAGTSPDQARLWLLICPAFSWQLSSRMITVDTLDALQNYRRIRTYLSGKGILEARRVQVSQPKNASSPVYALADNEAFIDEFEGVKLNWVHLLTDRSGNTAATGRSREQEKRSYQLRLLAKHQQVVPKYIDHITSQAAELEHLNRDVQASARI